MKKYEITLKYRQQLVTHKVRAGYQEEAELFAKAAAARVLDPRKTLWPPVMQQLKIESIKIIK